MHSSLLHERRKLPRIHRRCSGISVWSSDRQKGNSGDTALWRRMRRLTPTHKRINGFEAVYASGAVCGVTLLSLRLWSVYNNLCYTIIVYDQRLCLADYAEIKQTLIIINNLQTIKLYYLSRHVHILTLSFKPIFSDLPWRAMRTQSKSWWRLVVFKYYALTNFIRTVDVDYLNVFKQMFIAICLKNNVCACQIRLNRRVLLCQFE